MAEDIVERLRKTAADAIAWEGETMKRWDNIRAMLMDGNTGDLPRLIFESIMDGHAEEMQEAATTIEALRAQLATEHALSFKAGIEAAAREAERQMAEELADAGEHATARSIRDAITSLPTPPSPLPEILEAMRPVAEQIAKADAARSVLGSVTSMHVACDHLRAIAAVFTKLGGKIDAG